MTLVGFGDIRDTARVLSEHQGTSSSKVTHPPQHIRASTTLSASEPKIPSKDNSSIHSHIHYLPTVSFLKMVLPAWIESQRVP